MDQLGGQTGRWSELVGKKEAEEIHVEQRGRLPDGRTMILKIRYFDIQPNHFSWSADQSSGRGGHLGPGGHPDRSDAPGRPPQGK